RSEAAPSAVQWHALGSVQPERVTCPVCGGVAEVDEESGELPTCSGCGTRDTWEARQGGRFRGIVGAIDACPSLDELGALGERLYRIQHTHAVSVSTTEWRRIWAAYRARRSPLRA